MGPIMEAEAYVLMMALVFFTGWLSWLGHKLNRGLDLIEDSDAGVEEIGAALTEVIQLLKGLPEWMSEEVKQYVPEFHINQQGPSWVEPIINHVLGNVIGKEHLRTEDSSPRDTEGRFIDGPKKEKD